MESLDGDVPAAFSIGFGFRHLVRFLLARNGVLTLREGGPVQIQLPAEMITMTKAVIAAFAAT